MAIAKILQRLASRFAPGDGSQIKAEILPGYTRALSPKLMTWYLPPVQNLGKDEGTSFAFGLYAPRFFDEVQFVINLDFIQRYMWYILYHNTGLILGFG
ncbi:hypothetical protein Tco_1155407 [Tanacetum coccineum]